MNLKQRLQQDLKDALRAHDERRKSVIRMALAAITNAQVSHGGELDDAGLVNALQQEARQRRDAIVELEKANRSEALAEAQAELVILETYLPRLLSREEITREVKRVIEELGATGMQQMGPVMSQLMKELKDRADGRLVNQIVRELLTS
ncbi:MAG TPA: GatB/YqeY domain-containing protein [Chloroflexi bacterium]|nr:GatB/YqeY domain-containing protein [Chloroflexota bacterium]